MAYPKWLFGPTEIAWKIYKGKFWKKGWRITFFVLKLIFIFLSGIQICLAPAHILIKCDLARLGIDKY